ncbi:uncharacterized protein LOC115473855 [Microcaecilia unicolor]|uniref:Uncharacterized protein LOC115473855 n=1 Tax=Microcaecilia unicolor TaxID=1415580 RepID=A0A6P7YBJ5_9AMPH|nr:uncharacterized protein LOC115473855 [Microcaecilia unicolor]XP_030064862.1 uncharacterized protein LOC115473855 [Microcaecilia unicolor]XP_030064863.1 uncharacterized protein LOC115473855 [Microcaecilia unicolor]
MKAIILAAGYGTRLLRDLQNANCEEFKHLLGLPKPLLPVGHLPLISHWVAAFDAIDDVADIFVVTNDHYYAKFEEWAQRHKSVTVINDGTKSNEERLGAIACLQLVLDKFSIDDHIIVVAGDTLFFENFSLREILAKFDKMQHENNEANLVLAYLCKDEETRNYGILETDKNLRVTALKEKPSSEETDSRRACPCFYVLSKNTLPLIQGFLEEKKNAPVEEKDAPGHLIAWLVSRKPVFVHMICGRFDVGNLLSYISCNKYFLDKIDNLTDYLQ